jgi:glycopeptide antibiotics resistance protein
LALTGLWAAWLLYMTLTPDSTPNANFPLPFRDHAQALGCVLTACPRSANSLRALFIDLLGNVAVFVPLGVGLAVVLHREPGRTMHHPPRDRKTTLLLCLLGGALLSTFIETVQYTIPTRAADLTDLALNSLGAALGAQALLVLTESSLWATITRPRDANTEENERWCK